MNKDEAKEWVDYIASVLWDADRAHSSEDDLHSSFIEYAAGQEGELGEIAKVILQTKSLDFPRWCA